MTSSRPEERSAAISAVSILEWMQDNSRHVVGLSPELLARLSELPRNERPRDGSIVRPIIASQIDRGDGFVRVHARLAKSHWIVDCWIDRGSVTNFALCGPLPQAPPILRRLGKVTFRASGPPKGPPVLLIHGAGNDSVVWSQIMNALAGEARCIAIDLPGHGFNEEQRLSNIHDAAAHIQDFIGLLAPPDSWLAVGHSLGGHIALELAAEMGSPFVAIEGPIWLATPSVESLGEGAFKLLGSQDIHDLLLRSTEPSAFVFATQYDSGEDAALALHVRTELAEFVTCELKGRATVHWAECGHDVPLEAPDLIVRLIRSVLDSRGGSSWDKSVSRSGLNA